MNENLFINPYSFIHINSKAPEREKRTKGSLSGVIECTLSVKSPTMIPNTTAEKFEEQLSETDRNGKPKTHKHKVFYSYENLKDKSVDSLAAFTRPDNPVIPGSEIRGMIRNIYEQLTNSCFSQIDEFNLPYKRTPEPKIMCIMVFDEQSEKWKIYPAVKNDLTTGNIKKGTDYFTGTADVNGSRISFERKSWYKKFEDVYQNSLSRAQRNNDTKPENTAAKEVNRKVAGCFENVFRLIKNEGNRVSYNRNANQLTPAANGNFYIHVPSYMSTKILAGPDKDKPTANRMIVYTGTPSGTGFLLDDDTIERFRLVLGLNEDVKGGYNDKNINQNKFSSKVSAYYAKCFEEKKPLIVYADKNSVQHDFNTSECVVYLSMSGMTKEFFSNKIIEILAKNHKHQPCTDTAEACPACRLFGMVDKGERTGALKGKLRFTDTYKCSGIEYLDAQTLPILGSPRISSTEFYLCPPAGWSSPYEGVWNYDYYTICSEDSNGSTVYNRQKYTPELAGRKVYVNSVYPSGGYHEDKNNMNCTVYPIKSGSFKFKVFFDGISSEELGNILFCLRLDDKDGGTVHKIGMGKPIGMGQVSLSVDSISGYTYTVDNGEIKKTPVPVDEPAYEEKYRNEASAVLKASKNIDIDAPIEYPWEKRINKGKEEHPVYEWFGKNRGSVKAPAIIQTLPAITDTDITLRHFDIAPREDRQQSGRNSRNYGGNNARIDFGEKLTQTDNKPTHKKGECAVCGKPAKLNPKGKPMALCEECYNKKVTVICEKCHKEFETIEHYKDTNKLCPDCSKPDSKK